MKLRRILNEISKSEITYKLQSNVVYAYDENNTKVGHLKSIPTPHESAFTIDYVEVKPPYRNLGIYKELIKQTFKLRNAQTLYSEDRLDFVNGLYRKWTNNPNLQRYDKVKINLVNDNLKFNVNE